MDRFLPRFAGMPIQFKIRVGLAVALFPLVLMLGASFWAVETSRTVNALVTERVVPELLAAKDLREKGLRLIDALDKLAVVAVALHNNPTRLAETLAREWSAVDTASKAFAASYEAMAALEIEVVDPAGAGIQTHMMTAAQELAAMPAQVAKVLNTTPTVNEIVRLRRQFKDSAYRFHTLIDDELAHEKHELAEGGDDMKNAVNVALTTVSVGLLMILAAYLLSTSHLSRRIVRPLLSLRNAALRLGNGDFDVTLKKATEDEIGELVDAFLQMTRRLKDDIAERDKARDALRASEQRLLKAQHLAQIGSWERIPQTNRLRWSSEALRIFGYDAGMTDLPVHDWKRRIHPDDIGPTLTILDANRDRGATFDLRYRIVRPDGSVRVIHERIERELDAAGVIIGETGTLQDITEQDRAQRALQDSSARLLAAQRRARLAYWTSGADSITSSIWSEEAANVLGVPPEQVPVNDDDYRRLIHPDDLPRANAAYHDLYYQAKGYTIEYRILRPGGEIGWIREIADVELDPAGQLRRQMGTIQDITDQKRDIAERDKSQRALEDSSALLLAAQRRAKLAYWYWEAGSGTSSAWSEEAANVLGVPPEQVPVNDDDYRRLIHPDDLQRANAAYHDIYYEAKGYTIEYRILRPGGEIGWIREIADVELDPAGQVRRMTGTIQDVTDQRRAESALREREALLRGIMDHAPIEIVIKDLDGRYLMVNPNTLVAWGMTEEAILGRRSCELAPASESAMVEAMDREVLETKRVVARELCLAMWGESSLANDWTYEIKFPIPDANGRIAAIGGIAVNITSQKLAEEELTRAKERAEAADRAKSQFLANMTHELRTPLNAIIGFAEIICKQSFGAITPPKYLDYVGDIHASGEYLLGIVNDILELSRIEAAGFELREETCDPHEIVAGPVRMIREQAAQGGLVVALEVPEGLPLIVADARALKQVLLNLLSNAVKFTRSGGRILVAAGISEAGGLSFRVSDTGIGIAPEHLGKIFDRFAQVDDSYARQHGGTGLGLYIARKLVELHQGAIRIDSELGAGTAVTITLPPERVRLCEAPSERRDAASVLRS